MSDDRNDRVIVNKAALKRILSGSGAIGPCPEPDECSNHESCEVHWREALDIQPLPDDAATKLAICSRRTSSKGRTTPR